MPNHVHGIIIMNPVGADLRVCPGVQKAGEHAGSPLPNIMQWFKTMTTNEYMRQVKANQWLPFSGRLWQRNYYEHVVRNDDDLNSIREYIINNPLKWDIDAENPGNA
jgi:REP element-mobilizing transposase RayT